VWLYIISIVNSTTLICFKVNKVTLIVWKKKQSEELESLVSNPCQNWLVWLYIISIVNSTTLICFKVNKVTLIVWKRKQSEELESLVSNPCQNWLVWLWLLEKKQFLR
jgi:hypothetical protein